MHGQSLFHMNDQRHGKQSEPEYSDSTIQVEEAITRTQSEYLLH